jgi:hypothetical protein
MEAKAKSHVGTRDASGIRALRETYPGLDIALGLVLAPTERVTRIAADVYAVPRDIRPTADQKPTG